MDIKYNLFVQPLLPAYRERPDAGARGDDPSWLSVDAGLTDVGHGDVSFCYDNERPRHRAWLTGARLRTHVVTVSEYQQFIDDGGYATAALWLADGWTWVQQHNVRAPLYWLDEGRIYTLQGVRERRAQEPVCHVSYFEADAFARWASARLPTEFEWEAAASTHEYAPVTGELHPGHGSDGGPMLGGGVWEWTSSAYLPYPGYRPLEGALGEYNGKFMVSQQVLRGAAAITPPGHTRRTYRNFFYPDQRWMMSGIRLASDPM